MFTLRAKIWWFALFSRAFVLIIQVLFNVLIPDHDAGVFIAPSNPQDGRGFGDKIVNVLLGGLVRWDAQYFLHLANFGYTYENCLAFFPLYPLLVRFIAMLLFYFLHFVLSYYSVILISAVLINVFCFVKSAIILFDLSKKVLRDEDLAYKAAIFYCVNPANIFFTAPYSEALFAYLTFYGLLKYDSVPSVLSSLPFGLSAATRSNGVINIGFIVHNRIKDLIKTMSAYIRKVRIKKKIFIAPLLIIPVIFAVVPLVVTVVMALAPFVMFQVYSYYKFCVVEHHNLPQFLVDYAETRGLKVPGESSSEWCNASIPLAYSYVQSYYWEVGFLKYYQWKQIPNFLLALPVLTIILSQAFVFVKQNFWHSLTLGLFFEDESAAVLEKKRQRHSEKTQGYKLEMFVYIAHAVCLVIFCVLFIHVQVTTRMIASASPVLYWFAAYLSTPMDIDYRMRSTPYSWINMNRIEPQTETNDNLQSKWKTFILNKTPESKKAKLIKYYFIFYTIIGTGLFSNYYPWT